MYLTWTLATVPSSVTVAAPDIRRPAQLQPAEAPGLPAASGRSVARVPAAEAEPAISNIIDLTQLLKRSLQGSARGHDGGGAEVVGEVLERADRREERVGARGDHLAAGLAVPDQALDGLVHERGVVHGDDEDPAVRPEEAMHATLHVVIPFGPCGPCWWSDPMGPTG